MAVLLGPTTRDETPGDALVTWTWLLKTLKASKATSSRSSPARPPPATDPAELTKRVPLTQTGLKRLSPGQAIIRNALPMAEE